MLVSVILAILPVLLVAILLLVCRVSADIAGGAGLIAAIALALGFFHTSPEVIKGAVLSGFVGSLPIAFVLVASLFQTLIMQQSGALARIVAFIKILAPGQQAIQILLVNMAFGVLLTSLGAATVSIIPPILLALGYSAFAAILLPAIGYTAMCIYALLGIPAVVFGAFTGISLQETGMLFAQYMPLTSLAVGLAMLYATGKMRLVKEGLFPTIVASIAGGGTCLVMAQLGIVTITGIIAGAVMTGALLLYLKLRGLPLFDRTLLNKTDLDAEKQFSLLRAASPWIVLTVLSLIINTPSLPFFQLTFKELAMPVTIIPGAPELVRPLWQAYFWVIVSTLICLPILGCTKKQLEKATKIFCQRSWRVFISTAFFFALAYVMNHSGKDAQWVLSAPTNNMIDVLAMGATQCFGSLYPAITPLIGLLGCFVSGSQTSAIAMFTQLHLATAHGLGVSGAMLSVASAMGAGIAGVISPAKVLAAAAAINQPQEVSTVMRTATVLAVLICFVCIAMTLFWL